MQRIPQPHQPGLRDLCWMTVLWLMTLLLLVLFFSPHTLLAQRRGMGRAKYLGLQVGMPGSPTGVNYLTNATEGHMLEASLGHDAVFTNHRTPTKLVVNEAGAEVAAGSAQQTPLFQHGALLLEGRYQPYLQAGGCRSSVKARFYLNLGMGGRIHLTREAWVWNSDSHFISLDVLGGGGLMLLLAEERLQLYADGGVRAAAPSDHPDAPLGYAALPDLRGGLRILVGGY